MMMTIVGLFVAVVFVAALLFQELEYRVDSVLGCSMNESQFSKDLDSWKRHHRLLCNLVDCINKTFGLIILIMLSQSMIELTITIGRLMLNFRTVDKTPVYNLFFINLINNIFVLLVLALSSWNLKNKVCKCCWLWKINRRK